MKVVILAGGYGTRLSEETDVLPKPMVKIGNQPILWHIMKIYSHFGFNDFVILLGYKGYVIKEYFLNYRKHMSDLTVDLAKDEVTIHKAPSEKWKITLVDTGLNTMTGSRIRSAKEAIGNGAFMLTYGDGLADLDLGKLLQFHDSHTGIITMSSAQNEGRFGALSIGADDCVEHFQEKPKGDGSWVNAGFFVCENGIFDYLGDGDEVVFEELPLQKLASSKQLFTYKHHGFWMPMDTLRDKTKLNNLAISDRPWMVWDKNVQ
jgi:glucose-1-phosphate cytidylyltransferase